MVLSDHQRVRIVRALQVIAFGASLAMFTFVSDERLKVFGMFTIIVAFYACWYVLMATRSFNGRATKAKRKRKPADG